MKTLEFMLQSPQFRWSPLKTRAEKALDECLLESMKEEWVPK
jgi:hypothetical protein